MSRTALRRESKVRRSLFKALPLRNGAKKRNPGRSAGEWYGVSPSAWDWAFLLIYLAGITLGILGTAFLAEIIKQTILNAIFLSRGDLLAVSYGFGLLLPSIFLGILVGSALADLASAVMLRAIISVTGKTEKELIPAIQHQTGEMGFDPKAIRVLIYGKIGIVLLALAILGGLGGYARFTDSQVIYRDWPGIAEKRYDYNQVAKIWAVKNFRNKISGEIEATTPYYAVVFDDGWEWATTGLSPAYCRGRLDTGCVESSILDVLAGHTRLQPTEGIKNIDLN